MLKYSDLTKGQKRCIDAFVTYRPELASAETIATKDLFVLWQEIYSQRANGAPKVGFPNWLSNNNQIQRGLLSFPGPNSTGNATALEKSKLQKILNDSDPVEEVNDDEFMAELRANGIEV
jgi:hypothetical protein